MVDMKTTHTSLPFAGHTLHFVEFDPANFCEQDLLWLPHYARCAPKAGKNALFPPFGAWMRRIVHRGKVLKIKMSIDLRGGEVGMTQQLLHTTKIAARLQHMRSERVT